MNCVQLTLTALEPLVITDGSAESMAHQTLNYIPGNMLLGAFAAAWKTAHPDVRVCDDDAVFQALFLSDAVEWGHAYPAGHDGSQTVPVPLSFQKIKNHSGLPHEEQPDEDYCVFNLLRQQDRGDMKKAYAQRYPERATEAIKTKKLPAGFMVLETCRQPVVRTQWNMHVALGRQRSAVQGQLFGFSSLIPGSTFVSDVYCADNIAEELLSLCSTGITLRVGHARSAGYGAIECRACGVNHTMQAVDSSDELTLFLLSDYMPSCPWENPLGSLEAELTSVLGVTAKADVARCFCTSHVIAGFNSQWKLPRSSRTALTKGGVLVFKLDGNPTAALPLSLGGGRREGYGRVLCNPAFLRDFEVTAGAVTRFTPKPPVSAPQTPLFSLLRRRAAARQVTEQALAFVSRDDMDTFIRSVAGSKQPSQSQRGNIRNMLSLVPQKHWENMFTDMLEKTPGRQWKHTVVEYPVKDRKEHLHDVMLKLLNHDTFLSLMKDSVPDFPGGAADTAEIAKFRLALHRAALLELLNTWEKASRNKGESTCA